jgi:hypothetical protein
MPPVCSALALSETLSRVQYGALQSPQTFFQGLGFCKGFRYPFLRELISLALTDFSHSDFPGG